MRGKGRRARKRVRLPHLTEMRNSGHLPQVLLVILICIMLDQTSKGVAGMLLPPGHALSYAGDVLRLHYVENPGAFLSLGATMSDAARATLFTGVVGIALAVLLAYLALGGIASTQALLPLSLIAGGGISNLIDRLAHHGHVIDFLNVGVGPVRTGIFNLADLAITTGVVLFFLGGTRKTR